MHQRNQFKENSSLTENDEITDELENENQE